MKLTLRNIASRFQAAVFDFDETMIDLEREHTTAYEMLCRAMNSDYMVMPEAFRHGSGRRVIDDIRDMRESFGWRAGLEELSALRQQYFDEASRSSDLALLPGVERVVRELSRAGVTLAVTSSAVGESIRMILRRFGLEDSFATIVDGSEVTRPKPDPEPYLLTARKLGLPPAACVVFEDSTVGVEAAKAAGMYCLAVRNPKAQMMQDLSAADVVLRSFEELV